MSKNELTKVEAQQIAGTQAAVADLTKLAQNAIQAYNKTHPIFIDITEKLLNMVMEDNTLKNFENSDLLRLLDIANKNQLVPIQELTKLTKELNILHERINASSDVSQLKQVVAELKARVGDNSIEAKITEPELELEIVEEVEDVEEEVEEEIEVGSTPPQEVNEPEPDNPNFSEVDPKVFEKALGESRDAAELLQKLTPQKPNRVLSIADILKTKGNL